MSLTYSTMREIGTEAPDFTLPATDGNTYSLQDFKDARALVIVFTCNHCPYARAVDDRLVQLARDMQPKGAQMVYINSNDVGNYPEDSFEKMKQRAEQKAYPFPYLYDESQQVARQYGAACTPDPFLFDADRKLYYRGRVDDNWQQPEQVTRQDLRDAIERLLRGDSPPEEQLPSMGCNIKWKS